MMATIDGEVKQRKQLKSPKKSASNGRGISSSESNEESYGVMDGPAKENIKNGDNVRSTTSSGAAKPAKRSARAATTSGHVRAGFESFDLTVAITIVTVALATRLHQLGLPNAVVFDELHFGKFAGFYMKRLFFFDSQPPLGKQILAIAAHFAGFDGEFKFERIGAEYPPTVPTFWLRLPVALAGSLLPAAAFWLLRLLRVGRPASALAAALLVLDNAVLTQSRFMLMEPFLLLFAVCGLACLVSCRESSCLPLSAGWLTRLAAGFALLGAAASVRYSGLLSLMLGWYLVGRDFWSLVPVTRISDRQLAVQLVVRSAIAAAAPLLVYMLSFYVHLSVLTKAGAHDTIMTSAFQASLEGGLASVIRNQPVEIGHGSQVTLRHTLGKICWLHSHEEVYPLRYDDGRGSSHQQQVSCYSFKDVNNWWIVKLPEIEDMRVTSPFRPVRDGDTVQLVHGMTARALNSHDVAGPVSPGSQEVSCYIDYNISMPAQNLWRVQLLNPSDTNGVWHAITSQVRLVHVTSGTALKHTGRQLPEWGKSQGEVVADKIVSQDSTVWNVEEHRYTVAEGSEKQQEDLVNTEMLPSGSVELSFWRKFYELQLKMLFNSQETVQGHMYASEPSDWPWLRRGVAYWISPTSNGQVYFLGNPMVWALATAALLLHSAIIGFHLLRRRRACYDIDEDEWSKLCRTFEVVFGGYLVNYIPYFVIDHTFFLHHYLPAYLFAVLFGACLFDHIFYLAKKLTGSWGLWVSYFGAVCWLCLCTAVFVRFGAVSYGTADLSAADVHALSWRETWDLIVHKE